MDASNKNRSVGRSAPIYTSDYAFVYYVPINDITHRPASCDQQFECLCPDFDASFCPRGTACDMVHANLSDAGLPRAVHVNYAWADVATVKYERFPSGRSLTVTEPNSNVAVDVMDSGFVLRNRALEGATKLTHCAHYYFNRVCHLGPSCRFVHAVFLDPEAQPEELAPLPSELGSGRELLRSKPWKSRLHRGPCVAQPPAPKQRYTVPPRQRLTVAVTTTANATDTPPFSSSSLLTAPCQTNGKQRCASGKRKRFSHNPYTMEAIMAPHNRVELACT
jgi:hypothetical protein